MSHVGTLALLIAISVVGSACGGSRDDATAGTTAIAATGNDTNQSAGRADVPDELPPDFFLPAGIVPGRVTSTDDLISFTGTMSEGTVEEVQTQMVAGLEAAGYELLSSDDIAVFAKNGVGRIRVRTSEFLDNVTVNVDIDRWSDQQLDEMRELIATPTTTGANAVIVVDGIEYAATGECQLQGGNRLFTSDDASLTVQIDELQDPVRTYADVTTPDGRVFSTEFGADLDFSASDEELRLSGDMVEYNNEGAGPLAFTATATCG